MKYTLKTWVAALTLVAGGAAFADTRTIHVHDPILSIHLGEVNLLPSTSSLYFSQATGDPVNGIPTTSVGGLVGALNVMRVPVTGVDDAVVTQTLLPLVTRPYVNVRTNIQVDAAASSLTLDDTTGTVSGFGLVGGFFLSAEFNEGVANGGTLQINNLNVDVQNKVVYADLVSNAGTAFEKTNNHLALWTASTISGPTTLRLSALVGVLTGNASSLVYAGFSRDPNGGIFRADTLVEGLKLTDEGFDVFADALGLVGPSDEQPSYQSTGYATLNGINNLPEGWGTLKATIVLGAVPEPQTYALMGLGLLGIGAISSRRRNAV